MVEATSALRTASSETAPWRTIEVASSDRHTVRPWLASRLNFVPPISDFAGEGYAAIYDVNQQPKAAFYSLQSDLALAAFGAPHRVRTYQPRA